MAQPARAAPHRRLAPRPLPYHLGTALSTWLGSLAALPQLRSGSSLWKGNLGGTAKALARDLERVPDAALRSAVEREIRCRLDALLRGIETYRTHPYRRALDDPPVVWREGTTRLLDYGGDARARPLLVVPSLINRAYVLDLARERSVLRFLAARGFRPLLVDWGAPGEVERRFTLDDYIGGRLGRALDAVLDLIGRPPILIGYCMGGLLTLTLALARADDVAGLALLATPWDFHAERPEQARVLAAAMAPLWPTLERLGELPVDMIQILFAALDPFLAIRKFQGFAALDPASPQAEAFVALEDWVNDGVPLAYPVAKACLGEWYGMNTPARGAWRIGGAAVAPQALDCPSLVVVPERDRIVPPASARALANAIPGADVLHTPLGHIGMIVSTQAAAEVWHPLLRWLEAVPS